MPNSPLTAPAPSAFSGRMGVSQKEITPPIGIYARNWGAAIHDQSEGSHRPLTLTCLTFQDTSESPPLVLIGADLGWWKNAAHERLFRQKLLETFDLPDSHLMFCLSHTHAGPSICPDDKSKPGGHLIQPYLDELITISCQAIKEATEKSSPATLTWQYGVCNLAVNRDLPDPDGERILTGYRPGVPADDTLLVGRITASTGAPLATIVNYACHPTTLAWQNRLISPDYVGAMRELVESTTDAPCLFLQGASGELSPPQQFTGDLDLADRYGRQLGYAVLSTLESMEAPSHMLAYQGVVESGASLAIWEPETVEVSTVLKTEAVPVTFSLKDFPREKELEKAWSECTNHVLKERLWRKICIRRAIGDGEKAAVPVWIWRLGNSIIVGQPNEAYSAFQTELRSRYPDQTIAVINLVNGSFGYLPPVDLYKENAYPVWQTPFAAGSLDLLTQTTAESIRTLLLS